MACSSCCRNLMGDLCRPPRGLAHAWRSLTGAGGPPERPGAARRASRTESALNLCGFVGVAGSVLSNLIRHARVAAARRISSWSPSVPEWFRQPSPSSEIGTCQTRPFPTQRDGAPAGQTAVELPAHRCQMSCPGCGLRKTIGVPGMMRSTYRPCPVQAPLLEERSGRRRRLESAPGAGNKFLGVAETVPNVTWLGALS